MGETEKLDGNDVVLTRGNGGDWFAEVSDPYYGFYLLGRYQRRIVVTNGQHKLRVCDLLRTAIASGELAIIPDPLPGELFGQGSGTPHPHRIVH